MKLEVSINKKVGFGVIGAFLILAGIIFVIAYDGPIPNPGHTADRVWIDTDGLPDNGAGEMTLQEAFDSGLLGGINPGPGGSNISWEGVGLNGWQNPIDAPILVQWSGNQNNIGGFRVEVDYGDGNDWQLFTESMWAVDNHFHSHGSLILPVNGKIRLVDKSSNNTFKGPSFGGWQTLR
ncbi:hypothetical protein COU62_00825 [Candidatus Pacearchaeota archaeon CG10_big_fil_rev_8_21_14_0_10_35_219]|nr:hypothetical protein [Candidatus Pacearchaeota archaeon]PIO08229.1 MAG: hypothetical protein COU62_00825 [Candidatus Pacearchaeota archaeon CG10_big_fil_rev_8_21_14_0_10_35_219]PIY81739.1 MAG: hypothetical protein COY79_01120 [Candidatus Pacearchaeota archaeon CG_4_10_14_0_8_um_filter_35_169]PIZ80357.1 MAG: hypothetical protein COY00_01375 [Candidatus Pacearchaeota archaeon CG_4_10_14_0_2_um_filter_35_33]PJA69955.1 MAG: hypothetical protein CO155_02605 [Candidatus Pacearchaeota archaeon CG_4